MLENLIMTIFGAIFVFYSDKFAKHAAECQRKAFHREDTKIEFKVGFIIVGIFFIISGLWSLFVP